MDTTTNKRKRQTLCTDFSVGSRTVKYGRGTPRCSTPGRGPSTLTKPAAQKTTTSFCEFARAIQAESGQRRDETATVSEQVMALRATAVQSSPLTSPRVTKQQDGTRSNTPATYGIQQTAETENAKLDMLYTTNTSYLPSKTLKTDNNSKIDIPGLVDKTADVMVNDIEHWTTGHSTTSQCVIKNDTATVQPNQVTLSQPSTDVLPSQAPANTFAASSSITSGHETSPNPFSTPAKSRPTRSSRRATYVASPPIRSPVPHASSATHKETCDTCALTSHACLYCVDCRRKLCPACVGRHAHLRCNRGHQLVNLSDSKRREMNTDTTQQTQQIRNTEKQCTTAEQDDITRGTAGGDLMRTAYRNDNDIIRQLTPRGRDEFGDIADTLLNDAVAKEAKESVLNYPLSDEENAELLDLENVINTEGECSRRHSLEENEERVKEVITSDTNDGYSVHRVCGRADITINSAQTTAERSILNDREYLNITTSQRISHVCSLQTVSTGQYKNDNIDRSTHVRQLSDFNTKPVVTKGRDILEILANNNQTQATASRSQSSCNSTDYFRTNTAFFVRTGVDPVQGIHEKSQFVVDHEDIRALQECYSFGEFNASQMSGCQMSTTYDAVHCSTAPTLHAGQRNTLNNIVDPTRGNGGQTPDLVHKQLLSFQQNPMCLGHSSAVPNFDTSKTMHTFHSNYNAEKECREFSTKTGISTHFSSEIRKNTFTDVRKNIPPADNVTNDIAASPDSHLSVLDDIKSLPTTSDRSCTSDTLSTNLLPGDTYMSDFNDDLLSNSSSLCERSKQLDCTELDAFDAALESINCSSTRGDFQSEATDVTITNTSDINKWKTSAGFSKETDTVDDLMHQCEQTAYASENNKVENKLTTVCLARYIETVEPVHVVLSNDKNEVAILTDFDETKQRLSEADMANRASETLEECACRLESEVQQKANEFHALVDRHAAKLLRQLSAIRNSEQQFGNTRRTRQNLRHAISQEVVSATRSGMTKTAIEFAAHNVQDLLFPGQTNILGEIKSVRAIGGQFNLGQ